MRNGEIVMKTVFVVFALSMFATFFVGCSDNLNGDEFLEMIPAFQVCTDDDQCIGVTNKCLCGGSIINQEFEAEYTSLHESVSCPDPACPLIGGAPAASTLQCVESLCQRVYVDM